MQQVQMPEDAVRLEPATTGSKPLTEGFEYVGYHDLDGHTGFKLAMQVVDDRWYLYLCYHRKGGWAVFDVTDPAQPSQVAELPFDRSVMTNQVQVADGRMITSLQPFHPIFGMEPGDPADEGFLIWDVAEPASPKLLGQWRTHAFGCHRNYFDGGRYVHTASSMPGFAGQLYVIVDIDDPSSPREVGRWWLSEQFSTGGEASWEFYLHGAPYVSGDRAYLSYGKAGMVILDISDVTAPVLVSRLDFGPSLGGGIGVHTVVPYPERGLAVVNSEPHAEDGRGEPAPFAAIIDIANESQPQIAAFLPAPTVPQGAPFTSFMGRGGRFGPHNQHQPQNNPSLLNRDDRVFINWYGAGVRAYDIADPYAPIEIGYVHPGDPTQRRYAHPSSLVYQGQDVLVDSRGFVYFTEMNSGLHIARYNG